MKLQVSGAERRAESARLAACLLTGKLFDADGGLMSPSFAYGKGGKAYSYYIALGLKLGGGASEEGAARRVSASMLDRSLCER